MEEGTAQPDGRNQRVTTATATTTTTATATATTTTTATTTATATTAGPPSVLSVSSVLSLVKFSHTVFALPFALASAAIAARGHGISAWQVLAILLAMAGARTAAMGFNRIVDRHLDAKNPRTAGREIPTGKVSVFAAALLTAASAAVFVAAAASLGRLCLVLSPLVLALVLGYSFTKRFTWLCHLFLGLAIGIAPAGAWIAVRGGLGVPALWLSLAVATWIGGFDVLYALADRDFDRGAGIRSIPARFGVPASLVLSALLHLIAATALVVAGRAAGLGIIYFCGVAAVVAILIYEHSIVRPSDLSRVDVAFFNLNGYVSMVYFAATLAAVLVE
jgi:4-hydroxybenzoate polyprenyltransferase